VAIAPIALKHFIEAARRALMMSPENASALRGDMPMIPFQDVVQPASPPAAMLVASGPRHRTDAGFAAHRNGPAIELMWTLAESFPTIVRMLGVDTFLDVAVGFVAQQAPTAPASIFYGEGFPAFLRQIGTIASAGYIADVADIDAARIASRQISEATAIPYAPCGNPFRDPSTRVVLHTSAIVLQSKFPAVTGWRVNQPGSDRRVRRWSPEDALIACTRLEAEVWRLPVGGFAFLSALIAGASLVEATSAASRASPAFDPAETAAILKASDIVTDLKCDNRYRDRRLAAGRAHTPHVRLQANVA
jgi:Putative DNA-binding domain